MPSWSQLVERKAGDFRHTDSHSAAQQAAHSQGFDMSKAETHGNTGSHKTFTLTPRSEAGKKKRTDAGKPEAISHRQQRDGQHELGYDEHGGKAVGKVGRDSIVDAMKSHWKDMGKTKEGSDHSPEAVAKKKEVAASNKAAKDKERSKGFSKPKGRPDKETRQAARKTFREWVSQIS